MSEAWTIAYKGAGEFGGKPSEYFREALRIAWSQFKLVFKRFAPRVGKGLAAASAAVVPPSDSTQAQSSPCQRSHVTQSAPVTPSSTLCSPVLALESTVKRPERQQHGTWRLILTAICILLGITLT